MGITDFGDRGYFFTNNYCRMTTSTTVIQKEIQKSDKQALSIETTQIRHLNAYRSISGDTLEGPFYNRLLSNSNPTNIPKDVAVLDKQGIGNNRCIIIRCDRSKLILDISATELEPIVTPFVFYGNLALKIRMNKSQKAPIALPIKEFDTFSVDKLCFPIYTNIMAIIGELVFHHDFPLEWSCCWSLLNLSKLPLVDSGYVNLSKGQKPYLIDDILAACISLDSIGLAFYDRKRKPKFLQPQSNLIIEYNNKEELNKISDNNNDFIPIPKLYLRRTSSNDDKGNSKYEIYETEEDIIKILRFIHQDKSVVEIKKKQLSMKEMISFCMSNLLLYKVYPTPYISRKEITIFTDTFFKK